jgi:hypothetical protein
VAVCEVTDASDVADNVETTECLGGFVDNLLNFDCLGDIKVVGSGGAAGLRGYGSGCTALWICAAAFDPDAGDGAAAVRPGVSGLQPGASAHAAADDKCRTSRACRAG